MTYVSVAVDVTVLSELTYRVPEHLSDLVHPGMMVLVPFRSQTKVGLVTGDTPEIDDSWRDKIRDVEDVVGDTAVATPQMLKFLAFLSEYYFSPMGDVFKIAFPSDVRSDRARFYAHSAQTGQPHDRDLQEAYLHLSDVPMSVADLKTATGSTYASLRGLEDEGWVDVTFESLQKSKPKFEKMYKFEKRGTDVRLGKKQFAILEFVQTRGPVVSATDIRKAFPGSSSSLKGLVEKGMVTTWEEEVFRDPFTHDRIVERPEIQLTETQRAAVDAISAEHAYGGFLLHGATGSGKTEVYVHVIEKMIAAGKTAIVLLPEIALTPQFVAVFRSAFGDDIAVLHSGLSPAQKFDQWRLIRNGDVNIVIGARSAIFAPMKNVGVIVVDEEHDPSFKQEDGPRYNARDMALARGRFEDARVILGSATPSLESYVNAVEHGRLSYLEMPGRVGDRPLPTVSMVDLTDTPRMSGANFLSQDFVRSIEDRLVRKEQSIVFLNRRGFSPCVLCDHCGHTWKCPSCDVSLTYHRAQETLRCHHCDHAIRLPERCPSCDSRSVGVRGVGTEQLESSFSALLNDARIARLDADTTRGKKLHDTLDAVRKGDVDVLVGTQMVTKGHDFPGVTFVGVVLADSSLNFPDFRGAERTFQLLTQVAGRAGRAEKPGEVLIQTYDPTHHSLVFAGTHDFKGFAEAELQRRRMFKFPPFGFLIALKFEAASQQKVARAAHSYAAAAKKIARDNSVDVTITGPALAPFERLRGKFRWQVLLKSSNRTALRKVTKLTLDRCNYFKPNDKTYANVRIVVDVDPVNML